MIYDLCGYMQWYTNTRHLTCQRTKKKKPIYIHSANYYPTLFYLCFHIAYSPHSHTTELWLAIEIYVFFFSAAQLFSGLRHTRKCIVSGLSATLHVDFFRSVKSSYELANNGEYFWYFVQVLNWIWIIIFAGCWLPLSPVIWRYGKKYVQATTMDGER